MDFHVSVSFIIILCFFLTILPPSYCDEDENNPFVVCNRTYTCGSVNISYPFWGGDRPEYCGHQGHGLSCINNEYPVLGFEALNFSVININTYSRSFTVARTDLWDGPCPRPPNLLSTTLNFALFDYASNVQNVTILYGCPPQDNITAPNRFVCLDGKINAYFVDEYLPTVQFLTQLTKECENNIKVPILKSSAIALVDQDPQGTGAAAVEKAMDQGFEVEYSLGLVLLCRGCEESGGVCGSNSTQSQPFLCFCSDQVQVQVPFTCAPKPSMVALLFSLSWIRLFALIILALSYSL